MSSLMIIKDFMLSFGRGVSDGSTFVINDGFEMVIVPPRIQMAFLAEGFAWTRSFFLNMLPYIELRAARWLF